MRKTKHVGVYQRCMPKCENPCKRHTYCFHVDLGTDANGKRRQETKSGFRTAAEAKEARAELLRKHKTGTLPANRRLTTSEWLDTWLTQRIADDLRPSTARSYTMHITRYLKPGIGDIRLSELRPAHIKAMYNTIREERHMSSATVRRINATLCSALNSAVTAGEIAINPARPKLLELPTGKRPKVRVWTPEQYGQFLDAVADHPLAALFHLAGHAGLRRGELCALRWEDCNLDAGAIVVRRQAVQVGHEVRITKPKTHSGEDRLVHLDVGTVDVLRRHRKAQAADRLACGAGWADADGLVFTAEAGRPWHPERVTKTFTRLVRAAELPVMTLHGLRHLCASLQLAAGTDIAVVSKMLGHSTVVLTADTYSHLYNPAGAEAAERAAALVRRARGVS